MISAIKPICKKAFMRRDGTCIIFIQYCQSAERRTLLNTGIAIPPKFWNLKSFKINNDLPKCYGEVEILNGQLRNAMRLAEDILAFAFRKKIAEPLIFLKKTFRPDFNLSELEAKAKEAEFPEVNLDVFHQFEDYMKTKSTQVSPKMMNVFRNLRDTLKAFEKYRNKPITFESFDFCFYEEFMNYMMYEHVHRRRKSLIKGFKTGTAGRTIKQLRIFLRNRIRRKIIPTINLEDYKIVDEESDAIYLTPNEVSQIYKVDLSAHPHLCGPRNLFVFGCLTGLRFSDFSTIRPEDVRGKMLYKKQEKSNQWVVVPLKEEAYNIFEHYFKRSIPQTNNPVFNRQIKDIARIAGIIQPIKFSHKKGNRDVVVVKPKYAWVTTHTCRRSFCTNEFLAGTPVDLIMKISGHKSIRDFYKYVRITPEEAGRKIQEIWQHRGDMTIMK